MTLRDRYLLLLDASPRECNDATNAPIDATRRATPAQQAAPLQSGQEATRDASTMQQPTERPAVGAQQDQGHDAAMAHTLRAVFDVLRGAGARESNTHQRNNDLAEALSEAINRACDVRGDGYADRAGLLTECTSLPPEGQADLLAHFTIEAARWIAPAPDSRVTCTTCRQARRGHCGSHKAAALRSPEVGRDLAALLQRCAGFQPREVPR